jgi:tetratricopeptide (TPR) repeat protein
MAQIGLRVYDREIESMIDRGQIDEAIGHSKHILKEFPKHIETYRLLGKCYLESQRYIEAADILQRVLSVYPDDFISHIGMSIICEDENNLEKAIWHMDRALEVQPSNSAVNSELRRLMTLRDGTEPSKVHLSQGAYIRMCVKSGLHEQAIAEAKSALSKEPQRIDLDLILARMYSETGQKSSALDQLTIILNKLPYCYDANLLMMQILISTNRSAESKTYKDRLISIDPYFAFVNSESPSPDLVADDTVSLEKNEWQYADDDTQRHTKILGTDWQDAKGPLATSGVTTKSFNQDSLPTELPDENMIPSVEGIVMAGIAEQVIESQPAEYAEEKTQEIKELRQELEAEPEQNVSNFTEQNQTSLEVTEEVKAEIPTEGEPNPQLPDWMKAAGWVQSDGQVEEAPVVESAASEPVPSSEIPDWIKTMAPAESELSAEEIAAETEKMELLEKILPERIANPIEETAQSVPLEVSSIPVFDAEQPTGGEEISFESLGLATPTEQPEIKQPQEELASPEQELPDWMHMAQPEPAAQSAREAEPEPETESSLPVWMAVEEQVEEEKLEFPDQKSLASQAEQSSTAYQSPAGEGLPDWLSTEQAQGSESMESFTPPAYPSVEPVESVEKPDVFATSVSPDESLPAWMTPADDKDGFSPQFTEEEIPEWLRDEEPASKGITQPADETLISAPISMMPEKVEGTNAVSSQDLSEIPDWLKEVNTDQNPVLSIPDDDILPDWAKPAVPQIQENTIEPEEALESFIQSTMAPTFGVTQAEPPVQPGVEIGDFASFTEPSAPVPEPAQGLDLLLDQLSQSGVITPEKAPEEISPVIPPAAFAAAVFAAEPEPAAQEESPFIDQDHLEENEPRVDETLVSKPFLEYENQVENQTPQEEPLDIRSELIEPAKSDIPAPSIDVESPVTEIDFGIEQPTMQPIEQPVLESTSLDQPIPDDTLDMTADIDIESWLNSIQEGSPVPDIEITGTQAEGVVDIQELVFQELSTPIPPEVAAPPIDLQRAETAPLVGFEEEEQPRNLSPLDELEEAGHFQSAPALDNLLDRLSTEPVEQIVANEVQEIQATQETVIEAEPVEMVVEPPKTPQSFDEWLDYANSSITEGNLDDAITTFTRLIKKGDNLDQTIQSLRSAVYRFPSEVTVWQALGDGYAKSNRLQEALDAYTKAEELIR